MALLTASRIASGSIGISAMAPVMAACACYTFGIVKTIDWLKGNELKHSCNKLLGLQFQPFVSKRLQICTQHEAFGDRRSLRPRIGNNSASAICMSAFNATGSAVETLPRIGRMKTITTPIRGEIKAPVFDNNGPRLPPRGPRGPGGGGGGGDGRHGGGGYWYLYGGFCLLLFLAFLTYLKDQEENSR